MNPGQRGTGPDAPTERFTWTDWPLRDGWPGSIAAPLGVAAAAGVVHLAFRSVLFDLIAVVLLTAALRDYLLPTRLEVAPDGLTVRRPWSSRRYGWDEFTGCEKRDEGLLLRRENPSPEGSRDLFLPLSLQQDQVRHYVQARCG